MIYEAIKGLLYNILTITAVKTYFIAVSNSLTRLQLYMAYRNNSLKEFGVEFTVNSFQTWRLVLIFSSYQQLELDLKFRSHWD